MKKRVEKGLRGLLLLLVSLFMMSLSTVFAQDTGMKMTSYASLDINENFETIMSSMNTAKSGVEKNDTDLLNELSQPDSSNQTEHAGKEESCGIYECQLASPR